MGALKLSDNAATTLAASIGASSSISSIVLANAAKFPVVNHGGVGDDWSFITLFDSAGNIETVKVTRRDSGSNTLTVVRGTGAGILGVTDASCLAWASGTTGVACRLVAQVVVDMYTAQQAAEAAAVASSDSAADTLSHVALLGAVNGLIKSNGLGAFAPAVAGTDVVTPSASTQFTAQQIPSYGNLTDGATVNWNGDTNGQVVNLPLGGNRTMAAPTNIKPYASYVMRIIQDGTGSRTLAWNAAFKFGAAGVPILTTTPGKVDYISFIGAAANTLVCLGARYNAE